MPFTPPGEYPYINDSAPGAGDGDIVYAEIVNVIMAYLQDVLPIDIGEAAVEDIYHAALLGRDAPESHPADAIVVDASGFNGNLTTGDDDLQKVAQKVDDLSLGGTYTDENARDAIATALTAGTGITVTPDDGADTITVAGTVTQYTDEMARDALGTALTAGTGITITPNDGADTITVASSITQYTDEMARDALGTALTAGSNITITPNDGADTITIAATGGGTVDVVSNVATQTILGRNTAGSGDSEELSPSTARTVLELGTAAQSATTDFLATSGGGKDNVYNSGTSLTGGITFDLANGNSFYGTLSGNVTSVTISNATSGKECEFVIELTQDSTPRTVTWGSAWKWAAGVPATMSTGSGAKDIIVGRTRDGGTTIYATVMGQQFS